MKVRIISEDGLATGALIGLEDGTPLPNIAEAVVLFSAESPLVTARITFVLPQVDTIAHVTVTEDHLRELAAAHGYDLKRRDD